MSGKSWFICLHSYRSQQQQSVAGEFSKLSGDGEKLNLFALFVAFKCGACGHTCGRVIELGDSGIEGSEEDERISGGEDMEMFF